MAQNAGMGSVDFEFHKPHNYPMSILQIGDLDSITNPDLLRLAFIVPLDFADISDDMDEIRREPEPERMLELKAELADYQKSAIEHKDALVELEASGLLNQFEIREAKRLLQLADKTLAAIEAMYGEELPITH